MLVDDGVTPELSYVHQDSLGSTSVTSDCTGDLASTISYFPFGLTRFSTGTSPTDKLFTGQRLDSTGLYYYGARYYDPEMGRFISADTIVPNPMNPQSLNRYSYCLNNPLRYIDPSGHEGEEWEWSAPPDYDDYINAYKYGFDTGYSEWKNNGSPTITVNDTTTTITISGTFQISGNRSIVGDLKNYFEAPEPGDSNSSILGRVTSGLSVVDMYLYYYSFMRTYEASQDVSFIASVSFNSITGNAESNITINSSYPQFYGYIPRESGNIMDQIESIASPANPSSSYARSTYVPSSNELHVNYDPRNNYLSRVTMQLEINYGGATNGSPGGVKINFGNGNYYI